MVRVVLYSRNHVQTNEVTDFCIFQLKTLKRKEVTDFMNIRLSESLKDYFMYRREFYVVSSDI